VVRPGGEGVLEVAIFSALIRLEQAMPARRFLRDLAEIARFYEHNRGEPKGGDRNAGAGRRSITPICDLPRGIGSIFPSAHGG